MILFSLAKTKCLIKLIVLYDHITLFQRKPTSESYKCGAFFYMASSNAKLTIIKVIGKGKHLQVILNSKTNGLLPDRKSVV